MGQRPEDDDVINPVQKLRVEGARQFIANAVLHLVEAEAGVRFLKTEDVPFSMDRAARFEVMMMMVFLKSMLRP